MKRKEDKDRKSEIGDRRELPCIVGAMPMRAPNDVVHAVTSIVRMGMWPAPQSAHMPIRAMTTFGWIESVGARMGMAPFGADRSFVIRASSFFRHSAFDIRHRFDHRARQAARYPAPFCVETSRPARGYA
jgi:hypothetical protein